MKSSSLFIFLLTFLSHSMPFEQVDQTIHNTARRTADVKVTTHTGRCRPPTAPSQRRSPGGSDGQVHSRIPTRH